MEKIHRKERLVVILKNLIDKPNRVIPLSFFTDLLKTAKSTISEDLAIIKNSLKKFNLGELETFAGAAGGVKYRPLQRPFQAKKILEEICNKLNQPERILPGGFLYMTDIIFDPDIVSELSRIFLTKFAKLKPDYIITIETKGIPLALMTAHAFGVPLVIIRDESKVTEGSTVSINYVSGSTKRIQTMALSRRALTPGSKVIFIDDFMRAGGTAKGMMELMREFKAEVMGIGVLVETSEPAKKLVEDYLSLLVLEKVDEENKEVFIRPNF